MANILRLENFLKNYVFEPAIEKARIDGPLYTSRNIWGNEVICYKHIEGDKWEEEFLYKLHTYHAPVKFTEDEARFLTNYSCMDELIDIVAQEIRIQNIKMFGGKKFLKLSSAKKSEYTCYQFCDWQWLIDDDGMIIHEKKSENGDVVYSATLVKYAVVVDKSGKEIDNL